MTQDGVARLVGLMIPDQVAFDWIGDGQGGNAGKWDGAAPGSGGKYGGAVCCALTVCFDFDGIRVDRKTGDRVVLMHFYAQFAAGGSQRDHHFARIDDSVARIKAAPG